jgi:hypothetical protein
MESLEEFKVKIKKSYFTRIAFKKQLFSAYYVYVVTLAH